MCLISSNTLVVKDHSVEPSKFLDSLSAISLSMPGRWHELSKISLLQVHCQICYAMQLQSIDLMPPMGLMQDTGSVIRLDPYVVIC